MTNEIKKRILHLPTKIEDIQKWILIGQTKLKAQIIAIKAIDKINISFAARQAALNDTQDLAEELLYAEAKLGELLENIPKKGEHLTSTGGRKVTLPSGITHKDSHYAQQLAEHQEIIAETVARAREEGEVPVRHQVLRLIQERKPKPETPPLPKGKFDVIYADPPWQYNQEQHGKEQQDTVLETHYPTMTTTNIAALPIANITTDNAVLFLWVTSPKLFESNLVIEEWGFEYKTSMVWDKVKHNVGYYVSVRHEFLLICGKGISRPQNPKLCDSVQTIERSKKHSEKPEQFRRIIEAMYPTGKKLELFGRKKVNGWTVYGNELQNI